MFLDNLQDITTDLNTDFNSLLTTNTNNTNNSYFDDTSFLSKKEFSQNDDDFLSQTLGIKINNNEIEKDINAHKKSQTQKKKKSIITHDGKTIYTPELEINHYSEYCENCLKNSEEKIKLELNEFTKKYSCSNCGCTFESENDNTELDNDSKRGYNISSTSATPLQIQGGSYSRSFQKTLRDKNNNYTPAQKNKTITDMFTMIESNDSIDIPKDIALQAAEMYHKSIQGNCLIKRANVRYKIMAAFAYFACMIDGLTHKPKEIAKIMGINPTDISEGIKTLERLYVLGKVDIPINYNPVDDFINRYFIKLKLEFSSGLYGRPKNDRINFVKDLVHFTKIHNIALSSIDSSKCVGGIYFVINQNAVDLYPDSEVSNNGITLSKNRKSYITNHTIEEKCSISKSTYKRFVNEILSYIYPENEKFSKKRTGYEQEIFIQNSKNLRRGLRRIFSHYQISYYEKNNFSGPYGIISSIKGKQRQTRRKKSVVPDEKLDINLDYYLKIQSKYKEQIASHKACYNNMFDPIKEIKERKINEKERRKNRKEEGREEEFNNIQILQQKGYRTQFMDYINNIDPILGEVVTNLADLSKTCQTCNKKFTMDCICDYIMDTPKDDNTGCKCRFIHCYDCWKKLYINYENP